MQCISKPLSNGVEQLGLNVSRFVNRNVACYLYLTRFLSRLDHSPKTIKIPFLILKRQFRNYLWSLNFLFISLKRSSNEWAVAVWQVAIIFNLMCYSNTTASYQKPPLSTSIYIYIYIYIYCWTTWAKRFKIRESQRGLLSLSLCRCMYASRQS